MLGILQNKRFCVVTSYNITRTLYVNINYSTILTFIGVLDIITLSTFEAKNKIIFPWVML